MEKILVTGVAGYIGSVLARQLLQKGYYVRGLDILNFGGESLLGIYNGPNFEFIKGDIRKKEDLADALDGIYGVIHLAAIVGDPACAKQQAIAEETNWEASRALYDRCQERPNIRRFIFASTCSNYGKMEGGGYVDENSPLKPVSLYAELKVKFERYVQESRLRDDFAPTILRFATVYGLSPRMRFDLTVNEFVRDLTFGRELEIFGGKFWRPYCHVEDLARACWIVLESPEQKVRQGVFNVGDNRENYQKAMIAEKIKEIIPDSEIKYVHKDEDPRDYRVDFSKIREILGFQITKAVPDGIREINKSLKEGIISDPWSKRYSNI